MRPRIPHTYDEISRRTVLDPDGSVRPALDPIDDAETDRALCATIRDALLATGITDVGVEVDHDRIILRGWVRNREYAARVLRFITTLAPDMEILMRMHVGDDN